MKNTEFVKQAKKIATEYKTVYMWGTFGHKVTDSLIKSKVKQYPKQYSSSRQAKLRKLVGKGYWAFDCVGLIKGILWGWNGNDAKSQGGAKYKSNGVPDSSANTMFKQCTEQSTDFSKVEVGEAVWMDGHIGIYIGDGLAVEATTKWDGDVQITACNCTKMGYNRRDWTKHGKLPYVDYTVEKPVEKTDDFFPARGYFKKGDVHENVGKVATFMRKVFPSYTSEKALGNLYGTNIIKSITEFQKRTGLKADGLLGAETLAKLEQYGFKK